MGSAHSLDARSSGVVAAVRACRHPTLPKETPMDNLTPEKKLELRRTRERLARALSMLNRFECRLEALHRDRSGLYRDFLSPPLVPDEWKPVERSIKRQRREAESGCELSAAWVEETAAQLRRIETLRATPLPRRAPDYDGPTSLFSVRTLKRDPEELERGYQAARARIEEAKAEKAKRAAEPKGLLATLSAEQLAELDRLQRRLFDYREGLSEALTDKQGW